MTPERLQTALARALGAVCSQVVDLPDTVTLVRAGDRGHGDWTSNIALQTSALLDRDARSLAAEIADRLRGDEGIAAVEVSGPGFLTIALDPSGGAGIAAEIVAAGEDYGTAADPATAGLAGVDPAPDLPGLETIRAAYARARRIDRVASTAGVDRIAASGSSAAAADVEEAALLTALTDFPRVAAEPVPARLTAHLSAVAEAFHRWADAHPVTPTVDEDITAVHAARLTLDRAAAVVLGNGLRLLGSYAPERM